MNQFKRAQVIMLPTEQYTNLCLGHNLSYVESKNSISIDAIWKSIELQYPYKPQHLYIISEDEIKEGDWFIGDNISIKQCTLNNGGNINFKGGWYSGSTNCKKIIATTDTSLNYETPFYGMDEDNNFPQPSQQFIEKYIEEYNNGNIITDIKVEYKRVFETIAKGMIGHPEDDISWWNEKLKINPKDSTITIKKLKDSWNREEIIEQMWSAYKAANTVFEDESALRIEFDNWIDQNL